MDTTTEKGCPYDTTARFPVPPLRSFRERFSSFAAPAAKAALLPRFFPAGLRPCIPFGILPRAPFGPALPFRRGSPGLLPGVCPGLLLFRLRPFSGCFFLQPRGRRSSPFFPSRLLPRAPSQTPAPSPKDADEEDWRLLLVNRESPLPEGFSVPELTSLRNGQQVDSRIYQDLQDMLDAARAQGLDPLVCSSFRTQEKQQSLFDKQIRAYLDRGYSQADAEIEAAKWVAPPGTSEHQTGLAVDIVSLSYQLLDEHQAQTDTQKWLMAHCAEYGFILRYPTDKSELTGIGYEPWHYRYVGREAAQDISQAGLCLEEYLSSFSDS